MALIDFAPKKKLPTLPFEPSGIIRACCDDLEWVMQQNNITINMHLWARSNGSCQVCAAGAVILRRASPKRLSGTDCNPCEFCWSVYTKLTGLNCLRSGHVHSFLWNCIAAAKKDGAAHIGNLDAAALFQACLQETGAIATAALYDRPGKRAVRKWIAAARKLADTLESLGA